MTPRPCSIGDVALVRRTDNNSHPTDLCACGDFRGKHKGGPTGPGTGPCQRDDCDCAAGRDYYRIDTREQQ